MEEIRIDKFGHCVLCHRMLIEQKVIDHKVQFVFNSDHAETEFLLNDGSRMRVCMCKPCQQTRDLSSSQTKEEIMEAVKNGWQLEVNALVKGIKKDDGQIIKWSQDQADKHMEEYRKKSIDCHSEGVANHVIEERQKRIHNMLQENQKYIEKSKGEGIRV